MQENLLRDALITLNRNKTRTLLSGAAVAGGVFILLISLAGFNVFYNGSIGEIAKLNVESVVVNPLPTTKAYSGFSSGREWYIDKSDIDAIKLEFPNIITDSGPIYRLPGLQSVQIVDGERDDAEIIAMYPGIFSLMQMSMDKGRFIDGLDMLHLRKVCIIGLDLAEKWFGNNEDPCGKEILVGNIMYTIVGVLKKDNPFIQPFGNEQNSVVLPYSTADAVYKLEGELSYLVFSLNMTEGFEQKREDILRFLRQLHKVDPDDVDAVNVEGIQDFSHMLKTLFNGTKVIIWVVFIGIIISSLLGIFGIMLLSVRERKSEIAVRLAMGAGPQEIISQFVHESLVLSVSSSMIGLCLAESLIAALRLLMRTGVVSDPLYGPPQLSFWGILAVIVVVIAGGVLSGYLPARNMVERNVSELFYDI